MLTYANQTPFATPTYQAQDLAYTSTSATTGPAKGVMLTHHNILCNIEQAKAWVGPDKLSHCEIIVTALHPIFVNG